MRRCRSRKKGESLSALEMFPALGEGPQARPKISPVAVLLEALFAVPATEGEGVFGGGSFGGIGRHGPGGPWPHRS